MSLIAQISLFNNSYFYLKTGIRIHTDIKSKRLAIVRKLTKKTNIHFKNWVNSDMFIFYFYTKNFNIRYGFLSCLKDIYSYIEIYIYLAIRL